MNPLLSILMLAVVLVAGCKKDLGKEQVVPASDTVETTNSITTNILSAVCGTWSVCEVTNMQRDVVYVEVNTSGIEYRLNEVSSAINKLGVTIVLIFASGVLAWAFSGKEPVTTKKPEGE